jgi:hypothetical protein
MVFELKLIERLIVEAAEFRGETTEGPDKAELGGDDVNDETELRFLSKLEAFLSFTLHLNEHISRREEVCV